MKSLQQSRQDVLGQHLDVTFQQIQKYEKGRNRMSASILAQAANVLGVSPAFFFKRKETDDDSQMDITKDTESLAMLMSTKDALELNVIYARIKDPKLRQSVLEIVRQVAKIDDPRRTTS
nr:helix-turn-helix transcriptional regulator [Agrobacterium vitis]